MDDLGKIAGLKCVGCASEYGRDQVDYTCPSCGYNLDVVYDFQEVRRRGFSRESLLRCHDLTIFRYLPILPVTGEGMPLVPVGGTPLIRAGRLERALGLPEVYLKDDGRNPSASFKDRASAIGMMKAVERGASIITGASTGNAASSLSCLTASTDLRTVIFVPRTAPRAKIAQLLVYGAEVFTVDGTYDDAFDLCLEVTREWGWYNRNTGINPYLSEGKKTCALEIAEDLGWEVPDYLFVSVGDGCIIGGIHKGFRDLHDLGFIERVPKLVAVQASGSDAVTRAFEKFTSGGIKGAAKQAGLSGPWAAPGLIDPVKAETVADSISVNLPRDGVKAVRAVITTGGFAIRVTDEEIIATIPEVARGASIFGEPAGVASYAGLKKAVAEGLIPSDASVVCVITGNGLKDVDSAMKSVGSPTPVSPGSAGLAQLGKIFAGKSSGVGAGKGAGKGAGQGIRG